MKKNGRLRAALRGEAAFSLIEVNLAILVVAGGLLTLFALFPAGLSMSVAAVSDTRQALLADAIISRIRGNATHVSDIGAWNCYYDDGHSGQDASKVRKLWNEYLNPFPALAGSAGGSVLLSNNAPDDADWTGGTECWYATAKLNNFFVAADETSITSPARVCVRLHHGMQNTHASRDERGVDRSTWYVSLVISDQVDSWYYDNQVYCTELNPTMMRGE